MFLRSVQKEYFFCLFWINVAKKICIRHFLQYRSKVSWHSILDTRFRLFKLKQPLFFHVMLYDLYVNLKLSRNQSWVHLLFSDSQDLILDSILHNLFLILNSYRNWELHETHNRLSRHFWMVLYKTYVVRVSLTSLCLSIGTFSKQIYRI